MAARTGHTFVAQALKAAGVDTLFYLPGAPCFFTAMALEREGIRLIDVRHEQAAAMMAHGYSRVTGRPGVCMASSGPAVTNLATGIYNAFMDRCPVVALGGASPISQRGRGAFQELDQVALMKPITKWAERAYDTQRIPELVATAFRHASGGQPGPVYLDLPGDILYGRAEEHGIAFPSPCDFHSTSRPLGDPREVLRAVQLLEQAERPIIISGSGVWWSQAYEEFRELVELSRIPFFTTPLGRGVIPEDHFLAFPGARKAAFRDADLILVVGTRFNFVLGFCNPPSFSARSKVIKVDIEPMEMGNNRTVDVALVGDAKAILRQLVDALRDSRVKERSSWVQSLKAAHERKTHEMEPLFHSDKTPIHPLRLFKEVGNCIPRDAILVEDGNETLLFGRRAIPSYLPGHLIDEGPSGCVGTAVPLGLGAKAGKPDKTVVVLSGDGGFGMNGMELDTAIRHGLPVVVVINNNGGWGAGHEGSVIPGRDLGFSRYDKIVEALGGQGEFVQRPEDIRPALERALSSGKVACVNVVTDPYAQAGTPFYLGY